MARARRRGLEGGGRAVPDRFRGASGGGAAGDADRPDRGHHAARAGADRAQAPRAAGAERVEHRPGPDHPGELLGQHVPRRPARGDRHPRGPHLEPALPGDRLRRHRRRREHHRRGRGHRQRVAGVSLAGVAVDRGAGAHYDRGDAFTRIRGVLVPRPVIAPVLIIALLLAAVASAADEPRVEPRVHTFYYGWYATEAVDGHQAHWNHEVLGVEDGGAYPGGRDIGADFYPALGPYSSHDPEVIATHVGQIAGAGIGVIVASWWGAGSFEDRQLPALLDAAAEAGVEVAFHLEPLPGRDAERSREALAYLIETYGDHPACHRPEAWGERPVVYVYDSYLTPAGDWARLLVPDGEISIRGTALDCVMIGLWVDVDDGRELLAAGFDGYYTYFAADGFTFGSSRASWPNLAAFARAHDLLFVPCVGPGYCDTRIRPWNATTTRDREQGAYYDRQFAAAVAVRPGAIAITSFNEWHEGTQIEPAVPMAIEGFEYRDYEPLDPGWYLERTRHWVERYATSRAR
ncbi:hypothetical protein GF314_16605 [bacterium]|nr:hypothetical protein [bacterium]